MLKKKVLIVGSGGFIGNYLMKHLENFVVSGISGRSILSMTKEELREKLFDYDVVINLAGYPVTQRWTKKNMALMRKSRVGLTAHIVEALTGLDSKIHFINASAIGVYKPDILSEELSETMKNGFLAQLVIDWEEQANRLLKNGNPVSILRIGIVMGASGGAYKQLRFLIKLNAGAYFNGGKQALSFIYIDDLRRAVELIINRKIIGISNMVSPEITDYKTFMLYLKKKTRALVVWNVPGFLLKIVLGKASEMFLTGQRVLPAKLLANNFHYLAENIQLCVDKIEDN